MVGATASLMAAAPVAWAGGPTSVLLVAPAEGRAAALYTTDQDYGRLLRALGEQPVADPKAPDLHGGPGTAAINVTWLVHDVSVWRVDRVFVDVAGGPWVLTSLSFDGPQVDAPGTVHRAGQPEVLLSLLGSLGLTDGAKAVRQPAGAQAAQAAPVAQPASAAQAQVVQPARQPVALWLTGGLAGGVLLGWLAGRRGRGRGRPNAGADAVVLTL